MKSLAFNRAMRNYGVITFILDSVEKCAKNCIVILMVHASWEVARGCLQRDQCFAMERTLIFSLFSIQEWNVSVCTSENIQGWHRTQSRQVNGNSRVRLNWLAIWIMRQTPEICPRSKMEQNSEKVCDDDPQRPRESGCQTCAGEPIPRWDSRWVSRESNMAIYRTTPSSENFVVRKSRNPLHAACSMYL